MNRRVLYAPEGKVLTNGEDYCSRVYLGAKDSPDNWREITEKEYSELMKTQEENAHEEI